MVPLRLPSPPAAVLADTFRHNRRCPRWRDRAGDVSAGSQQVADAIMAGLQESAAMSCWDLITAYEPGAAGSNAEGDLITVIQPDGQRDTYRLVRRTPTSGGFGYSFSMEPVSPP